jgi:hypothetical protein
VQPFLLDELAAARIDELRRQACRERLALSVACPSRAATASRRSLRAFGFLLVGAGLRLVMAGDSRRQAGRSVA